MPRLIFANQLRGLAAIFVVLTHLVGMFWVERDLVSVTTGFPPHGGSPPDALLSVFTQPWLNFGPLGVAVFFLISGLVIPMSLVQHSRLTFLLARLLRIYPTYIVALLLQLGALYAISRYWGHPFAYSAGGIFANLALAPDVLRQPRIDPVAWTLVIELKFYVLAMLFAPLLLRGSVVALFAIAGVLLAGNLLAPWIHLPAAAGFDSTCLVFLLIGVLFNYRLRGLIGVPGLLAGIAAMLALFLACWWFSALRWQITFVPLNYFYALGIFGVAFMARSYFRPFGVLDFLARISFPLYVVHFLLGMSMLDVLMQPLALDYAVALPITLALLIALATLLQVTVEGWSIAMGRALSRPAAMARRRAAMVST